MDKSSITYSLSSLKSLLLNRFGNGVELYLFGSVARNEYHAESDIDVLVLVPGKVDTQLKEEVINLAYDIELLNDVVFNIIVRSKESWKSKKASFIPFHINVERESLRI